MKTYYEVTYADKQGNNNWTDVYKHLDAARGLLSTDKYDNKW